MREYDLVFAPTACEDLDEILKWLSGAAPEKVPEWYAAVKARIQTLDHLPERCPYAPENGLWGSDELRQLLFQDYPSKYRILFTVTKSTVHILNIRRRRGGSPRSRQPISHAHNYSAHEPLRGIELAVTWLVIWRVKP